MCKMLNLSIVLLIGFLSTQVNAKTIHLGPKETKSLANNSPWAINATCHIQGDSQTHGKIKIRVVKNNGTVNGKSLSTGQATMVNVQNNSSISVSADSGTQVNLINLGSDNLQAVCST